MSLRRHPADTYEFEDGRKIRLINERLLVKMDEESDTTESGLLFKPDNAHEHAYATGEILAFGYVHERKLKGTSKTKRVKEPYPIPDIEVGLKCCFVKFRKLQDSNIKVQQSFGDGILILKPEDLLFVFPRGQSITLGQ